MEPHQKSETTHFCTVPLYRLNLVTYSQMVEENQEIREKLSGNRRTDRQKHG